MGIPLAFFTDEFRVLSSSWIADCVRIGLLEKAIKSTPCPQLVYFVSRSSAKLILDSKKTG